MTEYMQGRVGVSLSVESADTILSVYSSFSVLLKVLFRGLCVLFILFGYELRMCTNIRT
jgi:hypothetical protein